MNNHKVLATFVVAILVASAFSVVGMTAFPLHKAVAQATTITTSADSHGRSFFGEGVLQVVINADADDDDVQEDITVDIDADPDDGTATSGSFTIFETSDSSGRFEFFLVHADSTFNITDIDPINTNGVDTYPVSGVPNDAEAAVITFGPGGNIDLTDSDLFEDVSFDFTVDDEEVSVDYEESAAVLELDRSTYGSDSFVYIFIIDQDGNMNPTEPDEFDILETNLTGFLFDLAGAEFNQTVTFEETGDNTARFEGIVELTEDDEGLVFTDEAVEITLNDIADYFTPADVTDSTDTSSRSFDIDDEDGEIDDVAALTFSSELMLTLRDNDRNRDSDDDETLDDVVSVSVDAVGGDLEQLDMEETDDNTGIFTIDLSNGELEVTFLEEGEVVDQGNDILELRPDDITEDILVEYNDTRNDDSEEEITSSQTIEMTLATGSIDIPEAAGINDDFIVTLTDADLNDNPRTKDSYTVEFDGPGPEFPLMRGGNSIEDLATLEMQVEGEDVDFDDSVFTQTFVETDINSGVFTTEIDMDDILNNTADVDDGDVLEITYNDFMDDTSRESSDELAIGEANTGVDFTRTTLPIPPADDSATFDQIGEFVVTTLIITDPDQNEQSNAEDQLELPLGDSENNIFFEIDGDGVSATIDEVGEENDDIEGLGASLEEIMPEILGGTLTVDETGRSTGVFDLELEFHNADANIDDWNDLEITVTYVNSDGDEESAGITFRGNDGTVVTDQNSAKAGTILLITVEDQDLNLDDDTVEEFEGAIDPDAANALVAVETEDEDLTGVQTEQFRETGADTGIFTATYVVGTDIPITELEDVDDDEVTQATNILITYNDEIDSTGGNEEIEIDVPVVTSTGAITVTPELVGPGTELTVIITDSDLDQDGRSTDDYDVPSGAEDSDDFFVNFRSDRTEVGRASPDIEETGPNTGVFTFTLELITDEADCEDDDLGDTRYDATGGSEPEIGACPGDLISISYDDEQDGSGRSTSVSAIVEVMSWDPEFSSDKPAYNVGDRVTVTISDPDANRKPDVADSLTDIRVFSDSDRVGEELSALETGRDTGVFRLTFGTASGTTGGAITVRTGDEVTVEYTDEFPADFEEEEDDKDFTFVVPFGAGGQLGSATPSAPSVRDASGGAVGTITEGQQVVLTTTVTNNADDELPFVALIEVRDSSGITVYLAWQTGVMNADDRTEVGLSWTPEDAGDYSIRTFVVSNLNNPVVLSEVMTTNITVS
jgi:hypothetical protein